MLIRIIVLIFIFSFNEASSYPTTPNPKETPGELCNPNDVDFIEFRYKEQIPYCFRNVDGLKKQEIYSNYGIPPECRHRYTIDHYLPLAIGGNNSNNNLWPEHKLVKATRARLENDLYISLKEGKIDQATAMKIIIKAKMNYMTLYPEFSKTVTNDHCDLVDSKIIKLKGPI